jgi:hypothetical protein
MNKEHLVETIKEWIQIDNDIRQIQKALKEFKEKKKTLSEELIVVMRENDIDNFDVQDGLLMYKCNKVKSAVNQKLLLKTLGEFFDNDNDKAKDLCKYILDSREVKVKESIQRKIK